MNLRFYDRHDGELKMKNARMKFIVGGVVIVAALAWLGFVGFQESKAYYITVDEFSTLQGDFHGKTLKIAGDVMTGSINRIQNAA